MVSLVIAFSLLWPSIVFGRAVLSEVMWMGSGLSTADEWVEMAGTGSGTLSGWTLTSLNSSGEEVILYRFGEGDTIGSGEYLTVSNFGAEESRLLMEPRFVSEAMSLPNTKLLLRLRDPSGTVMDEVDDGVGVPFAGENPSGGGTKASMERIDLAVRGNVKEHWATAATSQGFDEGDLLLGTPGFPRPIPPDTDPPLDATAFTGAWLPTATGADLQLSWTPSISTDGEAQHLYFDPALQDTSNAIHLSAAETSMNLPGIPEGSGYAIILKSEDQAGNVSDGVRIQVEPYRKPETGSGSSSSESSNSSESSMLITEILADAVGSDEGEWVEIGNVGTKSADIAGWVLKSGSRRYQIQPNSASGFFLVPGQHVTFHSIVSKLTLPNAGGTVTLEADGMTVDTLNYPMAEEGVSYGRDTEDPAWLKQFCVPTEGAANREASWNPALVIQSGRVRGEERVTINVEANIPASFAGAPRCNFDFGDGSGSENCNPSSHVYDRVGRYILQAEMVSYCGNTST
ncbi:MAG: lamin tail domain-containing protein, partial [Patescibacteria group bacterium]